MYHTKFIQTGWKSHQIKRNINTLTHKHIKTLTQGVNNTALTKEGGDGQILRRLNRITSGF